MVEKYYKEHSQKNVQVKGIIDGIRNYKGILRKKPIRNIFRELVLKNDFDKKWENYGDDAAVLPWRGEFLLLAADGIITKLLINEPYAAGKAAVMVTVNDIYSMGGRPIAMVNVLAYGDERARAEVVRGIKRGCEKLRVPMVGGHLHPDSEPDSPSLSVAIMGHARQLLRSHSAKVGDDLILAIDLNGKIGCYSVISWDANSGKTSDEVLYRLEALPLISKKKLANAAKDISNAGILGTTAIMMENSGKGAVVDLSAIFTPLEIDFLDWLVAFQSYGFILSVPKNNSEEVISIFRRRKINSKIIGKVIKEDKVYLINGKDRGILFNFKIDKITGISYHHNH